MTYSMTKIRNPNWDKARQKAYEVIKQHNIQDFPINIKEIISRYSNIKILTYNEFASRRNILIEDVIKINASEDGCIHYYATKDRYIILYNDEIKLPERIYWTLAHEFGHYILKHHKESNRSNLSRLEITDEEYDLYELEADFFARFLINPPSIIKEWNVIDTYRVMNFFRVSFSAANNTLSYLRRIARNGWTVVAPDDIKKQLNNFIYIVNHGKTCSECNSFFVYENFNFCPNCGSSSLHDQERGDDFNMIYPGIEVDEKSRATRYCPHCDNEEIDYDGDYCSICCSYLINECTSDNNSGGSCGTLPGNARYCFQCGSKSTFYRDGYLKEWNSSTKVSNEFPIEDLPF
ncbi:ImmA/IrrE family metallo-endopeptidase [Lysinibacillus sphaericus]|uniref:ImmA/IrrE family metallo-endopeptidase n=1 Tax=Lysinibacillus sphaericus TaxID=1421 RepID=UPI00248C8C97|nr:ImmA/IrrE family metallo-endopeptidase [Lysinibacillus sphaericus]